MDPKTVFTSNLPLIERIVLGVARRRSLDPDTTDDLRSWVHEKLVAGEYRVLRRYDGRSSLPTYLTVVIVNLYRDFNIHRWGKWRRSAAAKRLGRVAVELETLLYRDSRTLTEAIGVLRRNGAVGMSERQLAELASQLPERTPTRTVGAAALEMVAAADRADARVARREASEIRDSINVALEESIRGMAAEDQLILQLRFWEGSTVAEISRALGVEQKPLYRRLERLLRTLRGSLEAAGIDSASVQDVLELQA